MAKLAAFRRYSDGGYLETLFFFIGLGNIETRHDLEKHHLRLSRRVHPPLPPSEEHRGQYRALLAIAIFFT